MLIRIGYFVQKRDKDILIQLFIKMHKMTLTLFSFIGADCKKAAIVIIIKTNTVSVDQCCYVRTGLEF